MSGTTLWTESQDSPRCIPRVVADFGGRGDYPQTNEERDLLFGRMPSSLSSQSAGLRRIKCGARIAILARVPRGYAAT